MGMSVSCALWNGGAGFRPRFGDFHPRSSEMFISDSLRNATPKGNQAALQFLNTLKISIQAPFASPLQSKIRGKRSWIEHRDNLSPPLLSCPKEPLDLCCQQHACDLPLEGARVKVLKAHPVPGWWCGYK